MKASILGVKYNEKLFPLYRQMRDILEKNNISVDYSYIETSLESDYEDLEKAFERNQNLVKNSDFIIAETTQYSSGIGYLIATALNFKKPVLCLFNKEFGDKPSSIIKSSSTSSKLLSFKEYKEDNLEVILKEFLQEAKGKIDTKFILIIPSEIDRYLEFTSSNRRKHKAQIVRDAIEEKMRTDDEWQKTSK